MQLVIPQSRAPTSICRIIGILVCIYAQSRKTMYIWVKKLIVHSVQHGYFTFTHIAGATYKVKLKLIPNYKYFYSTHMWEDLIVGKVITTKFNLYTQPQVIWT